MTPEELRKKLEANPRFVKSQEPVVAFVILGEHVHKQATDYANRKNRGAPTAPISTTRKTWFIQGSMDGWLFASASRTDLQAIRRGETFLGIPWRKLKVGQFIEEMTPGKGEIVAVEPPRFPIATNTGVQRRRRRYPKMTYATLETRPVVITSTAKMIGYWLIDGQWVKMHPADVSQARIINKANFDKAFPNLPPLPTR